MDAIEQKKSEKKEKGYAPTVIRYTVYVNINTRIYIYILIYIFLCVCMPLRSSYAYLYNSRPLKLDPPWSDSHRRRSWPAPCTRSCVSGGWRSGWRGLLAGAWRTFAATTWRAPGHQGWPASCANCSRTWRRRPGSAAGARDDHEPHQLYNYSLKATFHLPSNDISNHYTSL